MDLVRRLHYAIKANDHSAIMAAATAGADVDCVWGMQGSALCQAILTGRESTLSLLLELGCDVNGEDFDGGFPLSLAIRKHLPSMALLLMAVPACDLNVLDPVSKQRPLCSAVLEGLTEVVEALVQNPRCDITKGNGMGNTALHLALLHSQHDMTKILARCEGLRWVPNLAGHAPVHIAATLGDPTSLGLLFPAPSRTEHALPRMAGRKGETPIQRELNQRIKYSGDTALHLAVREGHADLARGLIALGAAVDVTNHSGQTALLLACARDDTALVEDLLKHGAPPSQPGVLRLQQRSLLATHSRESSLTPLHIAASSNNLAMVTALCQHGADVYHCDERGRSVLHIALLNGAGEVALYLLEHMPNVPDSAASVVGGDCLIHAVSKCSQHAGVITDKLAERGLSLQRPNRQGNLPLHEALCWENQEVVEALLRHGADPNAPGELGCVPLAIAARTGLVPMGQMLLSAGAHVNGARGQGDHQSDGDVDSEDGGGQWSPLREAIQSGMMDFVCFLVHAGCDLSRETYLFTAHAAALTHLPSRLAQHSEDDDSDDDDDDDDDEDLMDLLCPEELCWLRERAGTPHTLLQLSMDAVRAVFRQGDPPFALMLALPLPEKVIAKLFYKDTL